LIAFFVNNAHFSDANTIVGAKRSANPDPPIPTHAGKIVTDPRKSRQNIVASCRSNRQCTQGVPAHFA
jgi:hypothetical protein